MLSLQAIGRLGRDAEIQTLDSGKKVIKFSIAVDSGYGDRKTTTWIECSKWGENTAVSQYLLKGTQVHVSGEPSLNTYTNKEGKEVTSLRLTVNNLTLLGGRQEQQPTGAFAAPTQPLPDIDDMPF